jgi:hypothetical protein
MRPTVTLTSHCLLLESCDVYSHQDLVKCELGILEFLQWKALVSTPSEMLEMLLCRANPSGDFTTIIVRTNEFIFMTLLEYEMTCYRYSSIALACLFCVLDEADLQNE